MTSAPYTIYHGMEFGKGDPDADGRFLALQGNSPLATYNRRQLSMADI